MTSFPGPATKLANQRSAYWDNIKGILIFLVVIAHFAMPYPVLQELVRACYSFHMPAFLFVSGYFSSRSSLQTHKRMRLICIFLLFDFILMVGKCGANPGNWQWFAVHLSAWYLLALVLYRLSVPFLDKAGCGKALIISMTLGLCVGLISSKDSFCMYKIIPLYPFFIAGYWWRNGRRDGYISKQQNFLWRCSVGIAFVSLLFVTLLLMKRGLVCSNQIWWQPYLTEKEFLSRAWLYIVGFVAIFALLKIVPGCRLPLITRWGRNSLILFVMHRPVVQLAERMTVFEDGAEGICSLFMCICVLILCNVRFVGKHLTSGIRRLTSAHRSCGIALSQPHGSGVTVVAQREDSRQEIQIPACGSIGG